MKWFMAHWKIVTPITLVVIVILSLIVVTVSGGSNSSRTASPKPGVSTSAKPTPTMGGAGSSNSNPNPRDNGNEPTNPNAVISPFTGELINGLSPVMAVSINNEPGARPATNLDQADIVYAYPVEGFSRLMAIYASHYPSFVGPIRSARQTNITLLRQFGRPIYVYSGVSPTLKNYLNSADIVRLMNVADNNGFWRDNTRVAPSNLYATVATMLNRAKSSSPSVEMNIGFGFSTQLPPGGVNVTSVSASIPWTTFTFTWNVNHWYLSMDGKQYYDRDGAPIHPATIVIQHVGNQTSPYLEYGYRPPYANTVGSGKATVLRNGKAYNCTWSRTDWNYGTTYTNTATGSRMTFQPGQVWIMLVN